LRKSPTRNLIESIAHPIYKFYSKDIREWKYNGLIIMVMPGIFHPGWFASSKLMLRKLAELDPEGKRFLELGCGSGVQACVANNMGAHAYASDITPDACKNATLNAEKNNLQIEVFQSDIFDQFPVGLKFDTIFVNPPFADKYPEETTEFAFCCGEAFEYFNHLFQELKSRLAPKGELYMALSKACDIDRILAISQQENITSECVETSRKWAETNYLYKFTLRI
jgi:release factor glutamine methyltransferase